MLTYILTEKIIDVEEKNKKIPSTQCL